jgi:hypothetical protein
MKIEEIDKQKRNRSKWFPMSKGYNRLCIVAGLIIAIIIASQQRDGDDIIPAFMGTVFCEIIAYIAAIWIYRGFNSTANSNKHE